jgi:hypothetical protein
VAVAGCNSKKPVPDAGLAATSDASARDAGRDAAGPEAANELEVKRYEDESPVDHTPLTVKTPFANAYQSYPDGAMVTTLKQGYTVTELAERNGFYRVTFDAPYPPARRLMGWMARFVFEDATAAAMLEDGGVDASARRDTWCKTELKQLLVSQDVAHHDGHCAYVCKDDIECKASLTNCEAAIVVDRSLRIDPSAQYTTVCTDAGAPPAAGGRKVPSLFGVAHRADGKCPPMFVPAPKIGTLCFRSCKTDADCPANATCKLTTTKEAMLCHANN